MGYDFEDGQQSSGSGIRIGARAEPWPPHGECVGGLLAGQPDWTGLRARFLAIHALRRTLAATAVTALPAGSFVLAGEAVLAECRSGGGGVNPVYSAIGKRLSPIIGLVAASPTLGDRGPQ